MFSLWWRTCLGGGSVTCDGDGAAEEDCLAGGDHGEGVAEAGGGDLARDFDLLRL